MTILHPILLAIVGILFGPVTLGAVSAYDHKQTKQSKWWAFVLAPVVLIFFLTLVLRFLSAGLPGTPVAEMGGAGSILVSPTTWMLLLSEVITSQAFLEICGIYLVPSVVIISLYEIAQRHLQVVLPKVKIGVTVSHIAIILAGIILGLTSFLLSYVFWFAVFPIS